MSALTQGKRSDDTRFNSADYWTQLRSPFSELRTVSVTALIELKSTYGLSALRDVQTTEGSGAISHTGHEFKLETTASGTDSATLDSAERGRYVPGYVLEGGIGVRAPDTPTGNQVARWGLLDDDDGFFFGLDADGAFVCRRSGGTDSITRRADWADPLDGSGPSGLEWDPADGHIYQIEYTWYGYGVIEFEIVLPDANNRQQVVAVHRERVTESVSVQQPNLPMRAQIANGGTATACELFVGGRRQHILGDYNPNRRFTSGRRLSLGSVGETFLPMVSLRRKAAFIGVSVKIGKADILTDQELIWQVRTGATLTGASWGTPADHSAAETALEADVSATAVSGGEVIDQGLIQSAQGSGTWSDSIRPPRFDFIGTEPATLCVRRITGSNATVSAVLGASEEW